MLGASINPSERANLKVNRVNHPPKGVCRFQDTLKPIFGSFGDQIDPLRPPLFGAKIYSGPGLHF